tara:strand:+ start:846 stop:1709 length:864 start_codon:yes stop_codon:yes gene_type:complete
MGMFDFNPADVRVATSEGYTNAPMLGAYSGYGGMFQGLGKLAGFQDEEDLLQEIYETSDFTTDEGRQKALNAIKNISPDKYTELVTQLNQTAKAEAQTADIEMQMKNNELASIKALNSTKFATEFMLDAGPNGQGVQLANWLRSQGYTEDEIEGVTTPALAAQFLNSKIDKNASGIISQMVNHMKAAQSNYLDMRMYEVYNSRNNPVTNEALPVVSQESMADLDFDAALDMAANIDGDTTVSSSGEKGRTTFANVTPSQVITNQNKVTLPSEFKGPAGTNRGPSTLR